MVQEWSRRCAGASLRRHHLARSISAFFDCLAQMVVAVVVVPADTKKISAGNGGTPSAWSFLHFDELIAE